MEGNGETVVLVHGLWMNGLSFALYRRQLVRRGFKTRTFSYATLRYGLAENTLALSSFVGDLEAPSIHLLGHSLGGLIILNMLVTRPDPRVGRVVLMGVPYLASHSASSLARLPGGAALVGRSLRDWYLTPRPALPESVAIGVLAGSRSLGLARLIPGLPRPNDGAVALAETRIPEARDSIVLPVAHSQMLLSKACVEQASSFLRTGNFSHD